MEKLTLVLLLAVICSSGAFGQEKNYNIQLMNATFLPDEGKVSEMREKTLTNKTEKIFKLIQFYDVPSPGQRSLLQSAGIELRDYIPNYAFNF